MNLTTASLGLEDDQARIKKLKLNHFTVRGGPTYINWIQLNTRTTSIATMFSFSFFLLFFFFSFSWRVFHLMYLPLDHLHPILVDHLNSYLSTYPIRHPLWFFVSCGSQDSTVQRSSSHKCSQKSSCSTFNVVVVAFF